MHTVFEAIIVIGVDVTVVDGCHSVVSFHNALNGPAFGTVTIRGISSGFFYWTVDFLVLFSEPRPLFGQGDCRVVVDGVISTEIKADKCRYGSRAFVWDVNQDVHIRVGFFASEIDGYLFACGLAIKNISVNRCCYKPHSFGPIGSFAVNLLPEQIKYFRAAFPVPIIGVFYFGSIREGKQVREGVLRDF